MANTKLDWVTEAGFEQYALYNRHPESLIWLAEGVPCIPVVLQKMAWPTAAGARRRFACCSELYRSAARWSSKARDVAERMERLARPFRAVVGNGKYALTGRTKHIDKLHKKQGALS